MKYIVASISLLLINSCVLAHDGEKHTVADTSDSVMVYKYDQSVQCGKAGVAPARGVQRLENSGITVKCSFKSHDGMMRPQACGRPSGNINVFEIPASELANAVNEGFKSVTSIRGFAATHCEGGKEGKGGKALSPKGKIQPTPRPLPSPSSS